MSRVFVQFGMDVSCSAPNNRLNLQKRKQLHSWDKMEQKAITNALATK